jgi:radical SAM superfamily enzyme YgiQ (UPF0313 family)
MKERQLKIMLFTSPAGLAKGSVKKPSFGIQPLGILYLASYLKERADFDYEIKVVDAYTSGNTAEDIRKVIADFKPHIIGVSAVTILIYDAQHICSIAKGIDRNIMTVIGGPHATSVPSDVANHPDTDVVVTGEGEDTFFQLCRAISRGGNWHALPGIAYKRGLDIVVNGPAQPINYLDTIPFPDLSMLPDLKQYNPMPHWGKSGSFSTMITSRGCPYDCSYCSVTSNQGRKYRHRSAFNIINELEVLHRSFHVTSVSFRDGTFTTIRQRVMDFCRLLKERALDVSWSCNVRANELDLELLKTMKDAGCSFIFFGIEQGNASLLLKHKKYRKDQVINAVHMARLAGIDVMGYFMLGMPEEDMSTIQETIRFSTSLPLNSAVFTVLTPYPGTETYRYCRENGLLKEASWDQYDAREKIVWEHPNLTEQQLMSMMKKAYRDFYLRPTVIKDRLKKIKNFRELFNHFKIASAFLK